jgi:hypothetical protein
VGKMEYQWKFGKMSSMILKENRYFFVGYHCQRYYEKTVTPTVYLCMANGQCCTVGCGVNWPKHFRSLFGNKHKNF